MLKHIGWDEAAIRTENALMKTFEGKTVTYDLHRQMENAKLVSTSEFGEEVINNMI
jgi:isocitrate dehydrogenase